MKSWLRTGLLPAIVTVAGILGAATSCVFDYGTTEADDTADTPMSVGIRLLSTDTAEGYIVGSEYENYLDLTGGDYRIFFFTNSASDGNDKFIARFFPDEIEDTDEDGLHTYYSLEGTVPATLLEYTSFKVMVLANWGEGNYPTLTHDSTIDDVCKYGTYTHKENFELGTDNLIPFYGIHEYTDVKFVANDIYWLDDPINMLRAMAKVEVVIDNSELELESLVLKGYNDVGYCAPLGVYKNSDYTTIIDGGWYYLLADGLGLHLYGEENDGDATDRELSFALTQDDDGHDVWYAYVPEYCNMEGESTFAEDYAYLQLRLYGYPDEDLERFRIYFRDYDDNGTASAGADYDIGRNTLYRFIVDLTPTWLQVHVDKWEDSFDNNFSFNVPNPQ